MSVDEVEIVERLARLETKLDLALTGKADHEARLRRLERALWIASGAAMAGGGLVGAAVGQLLPG